mmetsp:Transcript_6404/g.22022  ORF Transcript_6404/g.22022 Transcript_6404/m.22022 type:complete len:276 (-) Transcript_6404:732-1559(-)
MDPRRPADVKGGALVSHDSAAPQRGLGIPHQNHALLCVVRKLAAVELSARVLHHPQGLLLARPYPQVDVLAAGASEELQPHLLASRHLAPAEKWRCPACYVDGVAARAPEAAVLDDGRHLGTTVDEERLPEASHVHVHILQNASPCQPEDWAVATVVYRRLLQRSLTPDQDPLVHEDRCAARVVDPAEQQYSVAIPSLLEGLRDRPEAEWAAPGRDELTLLPRSDHCRIHVVIIGGGPLHPLRLPVDQRVCGGLPAQPGLLPGAPDVQEPAIKTG